MRLFGLMVAIALGAIFTACSFVTAGSDVESEPVAETRSPVLVELFTSEGCSSCPPADRALSFLEQQQPVAKADIVTLAFHVDYWDRLGWKDRFSSPMFSERQELYAKAFKLDSNYTPEMVVDGAVEFVGSDTGRASNEILKASATTKAHVVVTVDSGRVSVKVSQVPVHHDATVYLVIAEDGLSSRVERGENSGKVLEHVSVVRELKTAGLLSADKNEFETAVDVKPPDDSKVENLRVVVFVQENDSRKIVGIGRGAWKQPGV